MKAVVVLLLAGLVASALATENLKDKSLTKDTKVPVPLPEGSSTTASSDLVSSSTAESGDSSSTSVKPDEQSKPKFCTRQYAPVCGSNGKTYNNECEFENAQKRDPSLTMAKTEAC